MFVIVSSGSRCRNITKAIIDQNLETRLAQKKKGIEAIILTSCLVQITHDDWHGFYIKQVFGKPIYTTLQKVPFFQYTVKFGKTLLMSKNIPIPAAQKH